VQLVPLLERGLEFFDVLCGHEASVLFGQDQACLLSRLEHWATAETPGPSDLRPMAAGAVELGLEWAERVVANLPTTKAVSEWRFRYAGADSGTVGSVHVKR
jgi:hypothetical protein